MGLSASQSRVLTLTARLSDLELKAQTIQHQKIRLAEQSTAASKEYMDALDAQRLKFNYYSTGSVDATVDTVTASGVYRVADAYGFSFAYTDGTDETMLDDNNNPLPKGWYVLTPKNELQSLSQFGTVDEKNLYNSDWLFEQMQLANLFIQKYDTENKQWEDYSYVSSSLFTTEDDDTGVARAEAEYEYKMSEIQSKDKKYDLDLDNITTEHNAVDTEMDSVKKIVEDNVGRTFKVFS